MTVGIQLLLADLSLHAHAALEHELLPRLHATEQARYRRFAHPQRRHVWLAGRALLLASLSHHLMQVDAQALRTDAKGGVCYGDGTLHLSLSHSREFLAVAVARGPVGVDIEWPRSRVLLQQPGQIFSAPEADYLHSLPEAARQEAFYVLWTLKEATCKVAAVPLMQVLHGTHFDFTSGRVELPPAFPGGDWDFLSARIAPGWQLALALCGAGETTGIECRRLIAPQQWQHQPLLSQQWLRRMKTLPVS